MVKRAIDALQTDLGWTAFLTSTGTGTPIARPAFLCGQSAVGMPWAKMASPTVRKEDDYGFIEGAGVEMCYGVAKIFKKHPKTSALLKQWGMVTGFFSAPVLFL